MVLVLGMMISSCIPKGFQGGYYYVTKPTEVEGFYWNPKRHSDAQYSHTELVAKSNISFCQTRRSVRIRTDLLVQIIKGSNNQ